MALKDYTDSHVAVAVAATAVVCSPRMRAMLRRGAVHGVAGVLMAGDAVASFARAAGRGAQQAAASAPDVAPVVPATPTVMEATVMEAAADGAGVEHDGSAEASAPEVAKAAAKPRSPRTKAHTEDDTQITEANPDE